MQSHLLASGVLSALAAAALGQVPAGVMVVTQVPAATARPIVAFLDPLTARTMPVIDPLQIVSGNARAAVAMAAGGDLLVATSSLLPTGDQLVRVKLLASLVVGQSTFATGFSGTITCLVSLHGYGYVVGTTAGLYRVAPGGGNATPVIPVALGLECRDVVVAGTDLAALLVDRLTATPSLLTMPVAGGNPTTRPLSLVKPLSIGYHDGAGTFVFGNDAGELHAVDPQTLVPRLLVAAGRGPIRSIAYATNHKYLVFGTTGSAQVLDNSVVGPPMALSAGYEIAGLDWVPFSSKFTVEGRGCAGSAGVPVITSFGGDPFPGNSSFGVGLSAAAPSTQAMLGIGVDRSTIDLTSLGATGCLGLTIPLVSATYGTGLAGKALAQLPVPADAAIAGAAVSLQWFVLDAPANPLGLVTSARGRADF